MKYSKYLIEKYIQHKLWFSDHSTENLFI